MTEYKFRVWSQGKMCNVKYPACIKYIDGVLSYWDQCNHSYDPSAIAMLYAGLKDKNNIDIYDGDIVICHPEGKYGRREIKIDLYNGFNHGDGGSFEVIGNIYENPSLLNTKQ